LDSTKAMSNTTDISYESVPGFFIHDALEPDQPSLPAVPPRFGLIDTSNDRWIKFEATIRQLNQDAPIGTTYKFFLLSRHGEGYHNLALERYGRPAWDEYWAKLNGDGEIVWGPDPQLTSLGIEQARSIQEMWKTESSYGLTPPDKLYCSPLTRALHTCDIMLDGVFQHPHAPVTVVENCREKNGVHTCNKRNTRTYIATCYPHFIIEEGFTELDELWDPNIQELMAQIVERARKFLGVVFRNDVNAQFISLTAHVTFINGFLAAIGMQRFNLPTGGIIPLVVKYQASV